MALVISRKETEVIIVGAAVITIDKVSGNRVSIRIAAPPEVKIRRGELKPREAA